MPFIPTTWQNPADGLNDLEQRITDALAELAARWKTGRAPVPAIAANASVDVTVTFSTPFADANYTLAAAVQEASDPAPYGAWVRRVKAKTAASVTVQINPSTGSPLPSGVATLHIIAIHD